MVRLTPGPLARALHEPLYQRILTFCKRYTPELLAEPVVQNWVTRFYGGDPRMHMLFRLDDHGRLTAHAVIEVQEAFHQRIVICHQQEHDKPNLAHLEEGMEYIDKLVVQVQAIGAMIYVEKHSKALQKYGYTISRICMMKCAHEDSEEKT